MRSSAIIIGSRYHLLERLGSGGMGDVFKAHDYLTDQIVALKQIRYSPPLLSFSLKPGQESPAVALAREFRTLATLRHPNIIPVLDFGFSDSGRPYYTMSLIENSRDLGVVARQQDTLGKVALLIEVLQALIYLHRRGILHRDLKPGNVLVDAIGQVRVLDFGLSVEQELAKGFVGTLAYMAPEVLEKEEASPASDLYSVGIMAYEFFAGRHPFDTQRMHMLVRDIISTTPDFAVLNVPDPLREVIQRLLAKDPTHRYFDAQAALRALCDAVNVPLPAQTLGMRESFLRSAKFVGRDTELNQLVDMLVKAKQGSGSGWLVAGELGVGKSRLVEEVRIRALVQGFWVLRGQVHEFQPDLLQALCDALLPLLLVTKVTKTEANVLKPFLPDLERLAGHILALPDDPSDGTPKSVFQMIMAIFERQTDPVLLILEDLHWAGDMVVMLRELYDFARQHQLLIISTYRNDQAPYLYGKFDWQTHYIELQRFNRAEMEALAVSMLGQVARRSQVLDFIEQQSEGNAFFMVDVIYSLMEDAERLEDIGRVTLPLKLLSHGLLESARRRLQRVPLDYQPMLRLAAVMGRELDFALLNYVDDELYYPHWLAVCSDAAVLEVAEGKWRFAHDKLRDALLLDIDLRRLPELHQLAAEAIEAVYPDRPEYAAALANHWYVVGVLEKEEYYTRQAGIYLVGQGNLVRAEMYLRRANMLSVQSDPLILEHLVMVLIDRGKVEEAVDYARKLLQVAGEHPVWVLRATIAYISALLCTPSVDKDTWQLLDAGLQQADLTPARDQAARMYQVAAQWFMLHEADSHKVYNFFQRALHDEKNPLRLASINNDLAILATQRANWLEAAAYFHVAINQYAAAGDVVHQSHVLGNLCLVLLHQRQYQALYDTARAGLQLAEQSGTIHYIADNTALMGVACLYLDQGDAARQHFRHALQTILTLNHVTHQVLLLGLTAYWYLHHTKPEQAAKMLFGAKNHPAMIAMAYQIVFTDLEADLKKILPSATWQRLSTETWADLGAVIKLTLRDL